MASRTDSFSQSGWEKLPPSLRNTLSNNTLASLSSFPPDWPELEFVPNAVQLGPVNDSSNYFTLSYAILTPTSRGNLTINSTNTAQNPTVNPNWLSTPVD